MARFGIYIHNMRGGARAITTRPRANLLNENPRSCHDGAALFTNPSEIIASRQQTSKPGLTFGPQNRRLLSRHLSHVQEHSGAMTGYCCRVMNRGQANRIFDMLRRHFITEYKQ